MCFFFCQVWIVAKSFYFYFLSHCIRQTENIGEDFKKKKGGEEDTTVVSPAIHLSSVWSVEEMVLLSQGCGKRHLEKSCPGAGR